MNTCEMTERPVYFLLKLNNKVLLATRHPQNRHAWSTVPIFTTMVV